MFSAEEATELGAQAFPWGAFVDLGEDRQFVSLRYGVDHLLDGETVLLRFERDPGDTLQRATRDQLRAATVTGVLSARWSAPFRELGRRTDGTP